MEKIDVDCSEATAKIIREFDRISMEKTLEGFCLGLYILCGVGEAICEVPQKGVKE
jgi:hypothetical protein